MATSGCGSKKPRQGVGGGACDLRRPFALCYKRHMRELREWISEKMRRRPRRGPNESESTGKSGQELPSNQPAPLRPTYPEPVPVVKADKSSEVTAEAESHAASVAAPEPPAERPEPKIVVET